MCAPTWCVSQMPGVDQTHGHESCSVLTFAAAVHLPCGHTVAGPHLFPLFGVIGSPPIRWQRPFLHGRGFSFVRHGGRKGLHNTQGTAPEGTRSSVHDVAFENGRGLEDK